MGPNGGVVAWTDAHEGAEHAYAVALDGALRDVTTPVDVTPEGTAVGHAELRSAGNQFVLYFTDTRGAEAGLHARFLEADGRIGGPSVTISVTAPRTANVLASLATAQDGSFYALWTDEVDADSEDILLRHLSSSLDPTGAPVRVTDLAPQGPGKARAHSPSAAVSGNALLVSYRLEHEPQHLIQQIRLALDATGTGLESTKTTEKHTDRSIGEVALVNSDKSRADSPVLSCGGGVCVVVWHGELGGGASAAFIDPARPQPLWRKRFARSGSHPSVAVSGGGQAQVVWYEGGKLATATITRDGVGPPTHFARVSGEQPPPSISTGDQPGDWLISWLDYEAGHLEAYAARIRCK